MKFDMPWRKTVLLWTAALTLMEYTGLLLVFVPSVILFSRPFEERVFSVTVFLLASLALVAFVAALFITYGHEKAVSPSSRIKALEESARFAGRLLLTGNPIGWLIVVIAKAYY